MPSAKNSKNVKLKADLSDLVFCSTIMYSQLKCQFPRWQASEYNEPR